MVQLVKSFSGLQHSQKPGVSLELADQLAEELVNSSSVEHKQDG